MKLGKQPFERQDARIAARNLTKTLDRSLIDDSKRSSNFRQQSQREQMRRVLPLVLEKYPYPSLSCDIICFECLSYTSFRDRSNPK